MDPWKPEESLISGTIKLHVSSNKASLIQRMKKHGKLPADIEFITTRALSCGEILKIDDIIVIFILFIYLLVVVLHLYVL